MLRRRPLSLLCATALFTGCGLGFGPASTLSLPGTLPVRVDCLAGLVGGADGCTAPEPASCPPGSVAFFGEATCTPLGATCPNGFLQDPSGFGCLEAHPSAPCTGASRESPTSASCVPIGDCAAPFPPANATFFVDARFTTTDATHFTTIAAAAHKARAGAVIAVEAGTYAEPIVDPIDSVTIVGRCAEQVKLTGTGGNQVGVYAVVPGLVVRGLTITGHVAGVFADSGDLTLEDSVVEGNFSVGVFARDQSLITVRRSRISGTKYLPSGELGAGLAVNSGASLVVEDSAVTDNDHRSLAVDGAGVTATVTGSFIGRSRKVASVSDEADGVIVVNGASLVLDGSAVVDSDGVGLSVHASSARVTNSVLRTVHGRFSNNAGLMVWGEAGADLTFSNTTLADAPVLGLTLDHTSKALLEDCTVRGPAPGTVPEIGRGAQVNGGATLTARRSVVFGVTSAGLAFQDGAGRGLLQRVAVVDSREIAWPDPGTLYGGYGLLVEKGSAVDGEFVTVERATMVAAAVAETGSVLTLRQALLRGTRLSSIAQSGRAIQSALGGRVDVTGGRLADSVTVAVSGALGGFGSLTDVSITDTRLAPDGEFGYGVTLTDKSAFTVTDSLVARNPGVGLVVQDSQAEMSGGELARNGIGVHAQVNSFISESDSSAPLASGELRVSSSTVFVDNTTKVGVGVLPMPDVK